MAELLKDGVDEDDEAKATEAGRIIMMPTWEQRETDLKLWQVTGWRGDVASCDWTRKTGVLSWRIIVPLYVI